MLQGQNDNQANHQQRPAQQIIPSRDAEDGNTQDQIHHWVGHMPGREKTSFWEKIAMVLTVMKMALACWGLTYSWKVLDALSTGKVYGAQLDSLVAKQASHCDGGISSEVQGLRICFILAVSLLVFEFLGWVVTVETWLTTRNDPAWESTTAHAAKEGIGNGWLEQFLWWSFHWGLVVLYQLWCRCCRWLERCCKCTIAASPATEHWGSLHTMLRKMFKYSMTLFRVLTWLWGLVSMAQVLLYACLLNKLLYWGLWCPSPQQPGPDWLQHVSLDFFLANPAATSYNSTTSKLALPFPLPPLPTLPLPPPSRSPLSTFPLSQPFSGTGNPPSILPSTPPSLPPPPFPPTLMQPPPAPSSPSLSPPTAPSTPAPPGPLPPPSLCVSDNLPWQMTYAIFSSVLVTVISTAYIVTKDLSGYHVCVTVVAASTNLIATCLWLSKTLAASLVFVQWQRLLINEAEFCLLRSLQLPVAYLACCWLTSAMGVVHMVWTTLVLKESFPSIIHAFNKPTQVAPEQAAEAEGDRPAHSSSDCLQLADSYTEIENMQPMVFRGQPLFYSLWLPLVIAVFVLSHLNTKAAIAAGLDSQSPWLRFDTISSYLLLIVSVICFMLLVVIIWLSRSLLLYHEWPMSTTARLPRLTESPATEAIATPAAGQQGVTSSPPSSTDSCPARQGSTPHSPAPAPSPPTLQHPIPDPPPRRSRPPSRQRSTSTAPATTATLRHGRSPGPSHRPSRPPSQQHPSSVDPAATATPAPTQPSPRPTTQQHLSAAATAAAPTADRATAATVSRRPSQASMGDQSQTVGCDGPMSQRGMRWEGQSGCSFPLVPGATPPPGPSPALDFSSAFPVAPHEPDTSQQPPPTAVSQAPGSPPHQPPLRPNLAAGHISQSQTLPPIRQHAMHRLPPAQTAYTPSRAPLATPLPQNGPTQRP